MRTSVVCGGRAVYKTLSHTGKQKEMSPESLCDSPKVAAGESPLLHFKFTTPGGRIWQSSSTRKTNRTKRRGALRGGHKAAGAQGREGQGGNLGAWEWQYAVTLGGLTCGVDSDRTCLNRKQ